jgi:two-component system, response regulator RegA
VDLAEATDTTRVRKVLVIDDSELYLKNVARDFARQGLQVFKASNREQALRVCAAERPDLAIVDLFLEPPEDGLELLKHLKALDPKLFAILVSAHMSVAHAVMGVRAGADDVFLKPFAATQCLARVAGGPALPRAEALTLHEIEWEHIARTLQDYDGNITHAAESLGVFRQSLQRKIRKHAPRVLGSSSPNTEPPPKKKRRSRAKPAKPPERGEPE